MNFLQNYLTDDSNSDEENKKESTETLAVDYFNLNSSEGEEIELQESSHFQPQLQVNAELLSDKVFGPLKPEDSSLCEIHDVTNTCPNLKQQQLSGNVTHVPQLTEDAVASINNTDCTKGPIFLTKQPLFIENMFLKTKTHSTLTKSIVKHLRPHTSAITSLNWCVSRYNHLLLTSSLDSDIKLWNNMCEKFVFELKTTGPIKSAEWSLCGSQVFFGGFGKNVEAYDLNSGDALFSYALSHYATVIRMHPDQENVFLVGTKNNILTFDRRQSNPIRCFSSNFNYVLDIVFICDGSQIVCSTDIVSHDSANRTIMAWDFSTGALLSNQIYQERYTCPCLKVSPDGKYFVAQSNGDYIAEFSCTKPYKMKNKRFEDHKVSGYSVGCEFSLDGNFLISGDAGGALVTYSTKTSHLLRKTDVQKNVPVLKVSYNTSSTLATACYDGSIQIWK